MRKAMPPMEAKLWDALRALKPLGWHFRRQVPIGRYFADFACHHGHLVVEVDGETHTNVSYDAKRDEFVRGAGYHVLRVSNRDVSRNQKLVLVWLLHERSTCVTSVAKALVERNSVLQREQHRSIVMIHHGKLPCLNHEA